MNVLHVYRTYFPGQPSGIAEAIRQICLATKPHGIESTVFALTPSPGDIAATQPEAVVIRSRSWIAPTSCDLGGIDAFVKFRRLARQADLIHYHFPWPFADLLHLVMRPAAASVMTWHSDIVRQTGLLRLYTPLMNAMLRKISLIAATSPAYAGSSPVLTRPDVRSRVRILPLGINEALQCKRLDASPPQRLGLDRPYVLFLGAMRYYKGIDVLIEAAAAIDAPVVLAGGGPELARLQGLSPNSGRVIVAGEVTEDEKLALLQSCVALVLPSNKRSEAFGMVLVEAAIHGKPMVSCEIGTGTSFVNRDGETGFVVPPDDPASLASAVNRLLTDAALADRMGRAARRRYEECFSGGVLGRAHVRFYQEASNGCLHVSTGTGAAFRESLEGR